MNQHNIKHLILFLGPFFFINSQLDPQRNQVQIVSSPGRLGQQFQVGTPDQTFLLTYDTGSYTLWIPSKKCQKCKREKKTIQKFDQEKSKTFQNISSQKTSIQYLGGSGVEGYIVQDIVQFQEISVKHQFLLIQTEAASKYQTEDGIIGLANNIKVPSIFDQAFESKQIVSPLFGFKVGVSYISEKSYFYYNFTKKAFNDMFWVQAISKTSWVLPIASMKVNFLSYNVSEVIIDSGAPVIHLVPQVYEKMMRNLFQDDCIQYKEQVLCDCEYQKYENIEIEIGRQDYENQKFIIIPQVYLQKYPADTNYCRVMIRKESENLLGLKFFEGRTMIFDKNDNKIGIGRQSIELLPLLSSSFSLYVLNFAQVFLIVCMILLVAKPRYNTFATQAIGSQMSLK